jgi:hypothetical protein
MLTQIHMMDTISGDEFLLSFHLPHNNNSQHICGLCKTSHGFATTINQKNGIMNDICKCKVKKFRTNFTGDFSTSIVIDSIDQFGFHLEQIISRDNTGAKEYLVYGALINCYLLMKKEYKKEKMTYCYLYWHTDKDTYMSTLPSDVLRMILDFTYDFGFYDR